MFSLVLVGHHLAYQHIRSSTHADLLVWLVMRDSLLSCIFCEKEIQLSTTLVQILMRTLSAKANVVQMSLHKNVNLFCLLARVVVIDPIPVWCIAMTCAKKTVAIYMHVYFCFHAMKQPEGLSCSTYTRMYLALMFLFKQFQPLAGLLQRMKWWYKSEVLTVVERNVYV